MKENSVTYFQFGFSKTFPVFVRLHESVDTTSSVEALEKVGFKKVEEKAYSERLRSKKQFRLLNVVAATPQVASHIGRSSNDDVFGCESVTPSKNYQVYKYKGHGLMVFSDDNFLWELGIKCDFENAQDVDIFKVMIVRFTSLALAAFNVVGLWGVHIDEGIVVMKQCDALNEVIFIDTDAMKMYSNEGEMDIGADFQVLKLDSSLKTDSRKMKKEELYGYLVNKTSFFSYFGPSKDIKAVILTISTFATGYIYPEDSFIPVTDVELT